ncbi:Lrp/AsnC family transcriptional regulator [Ramlibacter sp. RBP-2]|uniref:Lrp/AsnC family transcriptional regulator n=1 Tax=Ramlibacter lithotrophicus TaxID=2606681 RepID=A0A7X6DK03_9BURK|nr:Lrp/AsnC family transcriptional regulator [Ramlibacter lithotrophicus]NKE68572.1 Lrp/AsnC family transcriptional regulator [Ramlibacter lithotrophicus]
MNQQALDRIDRRIVDALQRDGRLANNELAAQVNLSPSPCLRRVRSLEEAGVIKRYVALVDPAKVGLNMLAYVSVKLEKKGQMPAEDFASAVETWSEVTECYSMTGDMDYLLRVQVEDLDHFSRFIMGKLLKQSGVADVKSSFALQRVKETTVLPV